jgi:hypothetical protein
MQCFHQQRTPAACMLSKVDVSLRDTYVLNTWRAVVSSRSLLRPVVRGASAVSSPAANTCGTWVHHHVVWHRVQGNAELS